MTSDVNEEYVHRPESGSRSRAELQDYFCPFCQGKLFRGNVAVINMSCPHCFRYIRNSDFVGRQNPAA